ncbi:MAG: hypothetical protein H0V24_15045 [Chloroflexia bacterium]|nr:hypothetical protein [Chloroflexia bacterium]
MTPFATFALLYMTALFLELGEKWTYPLFTLATLLLIILIAWAGISRITFLIYLAITTSHFLLVQFPDVANHVNIAIYCNLLMMVGIVYSLVRIRVFPTDDDYFEMTRPLLQVTAILVYFLAGFHKLNVDFFDPAVSCVGDMVTSLSRMATSDLAGVPAGLILLAGIVAVLYRLLSGAAVRPNLPAAGVGVIGLIMIGALLVLKSRPEVSALAGATVILAMAVIVIAWELIGGPLLAVPRLQAPLLAFSWTMHSTLALIGFVDFGSLALALLFTFVPRAYLDLLNTRLRVPASGLVLYRAHLYFAITILAAIASGLHRRLVSGLLFGLAALVFIWPLLSALAGGPGRPAWPGVPLSTRRTPRWLFVFPAALFLHGITSYVGLRTAGNFSMFSNLRTEGPVSNHFLLGSNPLKLWSYQEDVVRFTRIDDRRAKIGYQYHPLQGNQLPAVEFRKLIYAWTQAGATIPMTFEYRGRVHSTEDIVNDPAWRTDARDWEMVLMDFRSIQPGGPNRCRW